MKRVINHIIKINNNLLNKSKKINLSYLEELFQINYSTFNKFKEQKTHKIPLNSLAKYLIAMIYNYGLTYDLDYSFLLLGDLDNDYDFSIKELQYYLNIYRTGKYLYNYYENQDLYEVIANYAKTILRLKYLQEYYGSELSYDKNRSKSKINLEDLKSLVDIAEKPKLKLQTLPDEIKELITQFALYDYSNALINFYMGFKYYLQIKEEETFEYYKNRKIFPLFRKLILRYRFKFIFFMIYGHSDGMEDVIEAVGKVYSSYEIGNEIAKFILLLVREISLFYDEEIPFGLDEVFKHKYPTNELLKDFNKNEGKETIIDLILFIAYLRYIRETPDLYTRLLYDEGFYPKLVRTIPEYDIPINTQESHNSYTLAELLQYLEEITEIKKEELFTELLRKEGQSSLPLSSLLSPNRGGKRTSRSRKRLLKSYK